VAAGVRPAVSLRVGPDSLACSLSCNLVCFQSFPSVEDQEKDSDKQGKLTEKSDLSCLFNLRL
jgi:hypothetical protein